MTQHSTDAAALAGSTRRRAIFMGAGVPIIVTAVAAVVTATWIPDLPDPVAVHWSGDTPDGFGDAWLFVTTPLLICALFGIFVAVFGSRPTPAGLLAPQQKFLLVTSVWMAGLLSVGLGGTLWVQRGLDDAAEASGGAIWMLWGLLTGFALAVPAWFLLPSSDRTVPGGTAPAALDLAPTERVSWSGTVRATRGVRLLVAAVLLVQFVVVLVMAANGVPAWWLVAASSVVLVLLVVATLHFTVTVDRRGLKVRSGLGWPRITIPAEQVADVAIVDVQPVAEFGGWGWRHAADGSLGVVVRSGEAIQVMRSNGRRFVVTVDDAATGAAVLAGVRSAP